MQTIFRDFREHALVHTSGESDFHVGVIGDTAVASFTVALVYQRAGRRYRSTGHDLWVFIQEDASGSPFGAPCLISRVSLSGGRASTGA